MIRRSAPLALWVLLFFAAGTEAQSNPEIGPFSKGATTIEFGGAVLGEAWNLNEQREWTFEGIAGIWWACSNHFSLGGEFQHARVFQKTPDAFVQGLSPLVRWSPTKHETWNFYVEAGPGVSWSDLRVPVRGTKFNYLFQSSAGVMRRVGRNTHALAAFRFVHLSNHYREGPNSNPDLEMLGAYAALAISF
jgi:hypothetical protein